MHEPCLQLSLNGMDAHKEAALYLTLCIMCRVPTSWSTSAHDDKNRT